MPYFVYILKCDNGSYYVGHTENPAQRFQMHAQGNGALHTRVYHPEEILHTEQFDSKADAVKREIQLKKWSKANKEALIAGNISAVKQLAKKNFSKAVN